MHSYIDTIFTENLPQMSTTNNSSPVIHSVTSTPAQMLSEFVPSTARASFSMAFSFWLDQVLQCLIELFSFPEYVVTKPKLQVLLMTLTAPFSFGVGT